MIIFQHVKRFVKKILFIISVFFHVILFLLNLGCFIILLINYITTFVRGDFYFVSAIAGVLSAFIFIIIIAKMTVEPMLSKKNNKDINDSNIRFFLSVKNSPKILIYLIYFIWLLIPLGSITTNEITVQIAIILIFDYLSFLVLLSKIIEYVRILRHYHPKFPKIV